MDTEYAPDGKKSRKPTWLPLWVWKLENESADSPGSAVQAAIRQTVEDQVFPGESTVAAVVEGATAEPPINDGST